MSEIKQTKENHSASFEDSPENQKTLDKMKANLVNQEEELIGECQGRYGLQTKDRWFDPELVSNIVMRDHSYVKVDRLSDKQRLFFGNTEQVTQWEFDYDGDFVSIYLPGWIVLSEFLEKINQNN